jgi:hypothetical protein
MGGAMVDKMGGNSIIAPKFMVIGKMSSNIKIAQEPRGFLGILENNG